MIALIAAAAAGTLSAFNGGSAAAEAAWTPEVGESVVYAVDGAEGTWEVTGLRQAPAGEVSLMLRRGDDLAEADRNDVRPAGGLFRL